MTTYADIHERVRAKLINPSNAVDAEIPSLVFEAHKRIERMHPWQCLEGEWLLYVAAGETATRRAHAPRAFLRLLDRKERPYLSAREVRATITDDASNRPGFVYDGSGLGGSFTLRIGDSVSAAEEPIDVGDVLLVTTSLSTHAALNAAAATVTGESFLSLPHTKELETSIPADADVPAGSVDAPAGDVVVVLGDQTNRYPLEWVSDVDVRRFYSGTLPNARPKHLTPFAVAEDGTPSFVSYPPADVAYEIRVPCLLSLLSSFTEPPDETEDNWLTFHGFELLVAWAAAEAFELAWDDKRAAMQREKANGLLRDLIALDASQRVYTSTLAVHDSVRGAGSQRTPKW